MPRWGDVVDRAWASRGDATKRTVTGAQASARIAARFRPHSNTSTLLPILTTMAGPECQRRVDERVYKIEVTYLLPDKCGIQGNTRELVFLVP